MKFTARQTRPPTETNVPTIMRRGRQDDRSDEGTELTGTRVDEGKNGEGAASRDREDDGDGKRNEDAEEESTNLLGEGKTQSDRCCIVSSALCARRVFGYMASRSWAGYMRSWCMYYVLD